MNLSCYCSFYKLKYQTSSMANGDNPECNPYEGPDCVKKVKNSHSFEKSFSQSIMAQSNKGAKVGANWSLAF